MKDYVGKSVSANCNEQLHTLTGNLYFYEDGFEFQAQSANGKLNMGKILYSDIKCLIKKNTFGLIPNGILVTLKSGKEYSYVVLGRNDLYEFWNSKVLKAEGK